MKLACVVHRFGADIAGGSEGHCRLVAEHLAASHEVTVLTTCAKNYVSWRNDLPPGVEQVNGITVRRFPVAHEREPYDFGRKSVRVFEQVHSVTDELRWLDSEGPACPALVRHVGQASRDFGNSSFTSAACIRADSELAAMPISGIWKRLA